MAGSAGTADCATLLVEEATLQVCQQKSLRQRATTDRSFVLQAHARYTSLHASQQHLHHYACMPRPCLEKLASLPELGLLHKLLLRPKLLTLDLTLDLAVGVVFSAFMYSLHPARKYVQWRQGLNSSTCASSALMPVVLCQCCCITVECVKHLLSMTEAKVALLICRWQGTPSAAANLEEQQDPEQTDLQKFKAIVAAFMFDTGDDGMIDDTGEDFVPMVQEHMEAAGEFGVAMDIADAVELAKSIKKVCRCFLQLCLAYSYVLG